MHREFQTAEENVLKVLPAR